MKHEDCIATIVWKTRKEMFELYSEKTIDISTNPLFKDYNLIDSIKRYCGTKVEDDASR